MWQSFMRLIPPGSKVLAANTLNFKQILTPLQKKGPQSLVGVCEQELVIL